MGVHAGGGLVVTVAGDLHGDQRVNPGLVEQCDVVVPEVMRCDDGFDALQDVILAVGVLVCIRIYQRETLGRGCPKVLRGYS